MDGGSVCSSAVTRLSNASICACNVCTAATDGTKTVASFISCPHRTAPKHRSNGRKSDNNNCKSNAHQSYQ